MDINENLKDYRAYDEMSPFEQAQVDRLVEEYRRGALNTDYTGITNSDVDRFINTRLNLEHMHRINEKLLRDEASANEEANLMRFNLFKDRWKNGYYTNGEKQQVPPVNVNVNTNDTAEVKALKEEVKSLKGDISELKELLIEKFK